MASILVELPNELRTEVARFVGRDSATEADFIAAAVREKLAACAELQYLEDRASRGSQEAYARILAKVPAIAPIPGDER